jgi:hypothetical protein
MNKKEIPHDLLVAVEEIFKKNRDIIGFKVDADYYYYFFDKEELSNSYFFRIQKEFPKGQQRTKAGDYYFTRYPATVSSLKLLNSIGQIDQIVAQLTSWIEAIRTKNNTESIYDDAFHKKYADYYYNEFKISDEDADSTPFDPLQQEALESYIKKITAYVSEDAVLKESGKTDEILFEIKSIGETLSSSTKNEVMKKIGNVLGKLYTWSKGAAKWAAIEFAKEVVKEIGKEVVKQSLN